MLVKLGKKSERFECMAGWFLQSSLLAGLIYRAMKIGFERTKVRVVLDSQQRMAWAYSARQDLGEGFGCKVGLAQGEFAVWCMPVICNANYGRFVSQQKVGCHCPQLLRNGVILSAYFVAFPDCLLAAASHDSSFVNHGLL